MPGGDGPVCLTRSAPADAYAGALMFYDVVAPNVVSRSGVLSSIVEAGVDARLPEAVTLSEFKAWAKVADALDDRHSDDWLKLTATSIRKDAFRSSRPRDHDPEHASAALLSLPEHLQRRLFHQVLSSSSSDPKVNLGALLNTWPSQHHAAILAAAITPEKALFAPSSHLPAAAKAMKSLPASPPSLLALHLSVEGDALRNNSLPCPGEASLHSTDCSSTETAAAVAAALCHHSSLTHLSIDWFSSEAPVAPAIACLTSLQTLNLGGACSLALEDVPHLKMVFDSLPRLQDLMLAMSARTALDLPRKHTVEADPTDEPQHCLASLLSGATALTCLDLRDWKGRCHFVANTPLSLPSLKQLSITSDYHCIATALLSNLSAPLAALEVKHFPLGSRPLQLDDLLHAQPLWASLSKFQQLRSICLDLNIASYSDNLHSTLRSGPAAALASLRSLHDLRLTSSLHMMLFTAQLLADRQSPVQRVSLKFCECNLYDAAEGAPALWGALLSCLSRLRLRHLELHTHGRDERQRAHGIAALQPLTQLTGLHLRGWRSCLQRPADCEALANMQQLRDLRIHGFATPVGDASAYLRAVVPLSALTELSLQPADASLRGSLDKSRPADTGSWFTASLADIATCACWPALRKLSLPAVSEENGASIIRAAAFPALQELHLRDVRVFGPIDRRARERLGRLAAEASIRLTFHRDPT